MYSPIRNNKVPLVQRSSPLRPTETQQPTISPVKRSPYHSTNKRKSPINDLTQSLSLEEYVALKKSKPQPKSLVRNASSPVRNNSSPIRNNTSPIRNNTSPVRNNLSPIRNKPSPVQLNRSSPIRNHNKTSPGRPGNNIPSPTRNNNATTKCTTAQPKKQQYEQKIQVCVRKRPLNKNEVSINEQDIAPLSSSRTIHIRAPRQKVDLTEYTDQYSFTFDHVFDSNTCSKTIYVKTTRPLVEYMFQGGKSTCFAYGQTGSGKTYTMLNKNHGLYNQATLDIFQLLNEPRYSHLQTWIGYYEIYQGQLYDLLDSRKLLIPREDAKKNIVIQGLKEYPIQSLDTMMDVFEFGNRSRTTCKTNANNNSSRSHAILQILLKDKQSEALHGKLNFIDLAGSERRAGTLAEDNKIRLEGAEINKSLLALKECIRALDQVQQNSNNKHTPFRQSKLTMVLKDSFIGNCKTCMIATISPGAVDSDHTLNTLRYADRVKELRGESDPRLLQQQLEETKEDQSNESSGSSEEDEDKPPYITPSHIKEFLEWHEIQIQGNEAYIQESKQLIKNLTQCLDQQQKTILPPLYKKYQQDLNELLNQKMYYITNLKNRIQRELEDE